MEWKNFEKEFSQEAQLKVDWLEKEYMKIKTGRPNPNIFSSILVDYYGSKVKLMEVANIQVVDGKQIVIKPYDKSMCSEINTSILKSNLGFTPQVDSDLLRITFPPQTEETRKASIKKAKEILEQAKIMIRNIRKDIHSKFKNNKEISKDDLLYFENELDKITKKFNGEIEQVFSKKEKELLSF